MELRFVTLILAYCSTVHLVKVPLTLTYFKCVPAFYFLLLPLRVPYTDAIFVGCNFVSSLKFHIIFVISKHANALLASSTL